MTLKFTPDGKVDRGYIRRDAELLADALDECVAALRLLLDTMDAESPWRTWQEQKLVAWEKARGTLRKIGAEP